jgi:hypothetical protein
MLIRYKITVNVETNSGEELNFSVFRSFFENKDAAAYCRAFADGTAVAHDGSVINSSFNSLQVS